MTLDRAGCRISTARAVTDLFNGQLLREVGYQRGWER
jgi:hypothetical protein